jgi:hypothetical protein
VRTVEVREEGVAMITAILVSFVVLALSVASVELAVHNSEASGYDRRRVQAIAAAEAGVDYYFSHLSSTLLPSVQCSLSGTLTNSPAGTFSVRATFYNSAGAPLPSSAGSQCPLPSTPASVLVTSVGRGAAGSSPTRTMQAYADLFPGVTAPFNNTGAIFGHNRISFTANANIGGSQYSDADLYSNGDITLAANSILYGNLFTQGSVTLQANSVAQKDVWADGSVTMQGNARVRGSVTSSTSSISLGGQSRIYGNARAGTTNAGGTVDGTRTANSPSSAPPTRPYPAFTYNQADWVAAGYTVRNYTNCAQAVTDIGNWWGSGSGDNVVRVTGGCAMTFNSSVTVRGNLAIVTDGSLTISNNVRFSPASGTGPWNLQFFVGLSGITPCSFTANPNAGVNADINTLIYTHQNCTVDMKSNSAIAQGQIIGGTVDVKHSMSFRYKQVAVPGTSGGGLNGDVRYKREVVTSP